MLKFPDISPFILTLGPLQVRWYGFMYILAFSIGWILLRHLVKKRFLSIRVDQCEDLIMAMFAGMLIGARALYMLVYYEAPQGVEVSWWEPFAVWHGGLSFHGAILGMLVAALLFSKFYKVTFFALTDAISLCGYIGIFFGRLGNFINAELYGRASDVAWAISFPIRDYDGSILEWTVPRHPSQLYEAFTEGIICFLIVWAVKSKSKHYGVITGIGIISYGMFRFICEFFREPDAEVGYLMQYFTMGQLLCTIMILVGITVLLIARHQQKTLTIPTFTQDEIPKES